MARGICKSVCVNGGGEKEPYSLIITVKSKCYNFYTNMTLYLFAITSAAFIQIATIYFLRANFLGSFLYAVPFILVSQFLFLWSYSKSPNFIVIWFVTTALTNTLAFLVGYFLYQEQVSLLNILGIAFVMAGIVLLNFKI
ncbi:MAG: hypothetical protein UT84_C0048G0005 [Candidatus Curtissbacteria bacterium GW2011_GWA1_40_16]|uniref:EamA domain-containing protein n=1 Tax=Candidatus Curtissbacteria bacterium GW2011_GWA1_40_16 TaxID=1618405 RepID=A0A0G0TM73_9BACT|nr:MAG: hypothetical protein UT84_C0048G0005 [Candidatus Curtissbacteria bacterium GW2011_GWA1_40_16]